jgi:tol-pal system protein YbgF
LVRWDKINKWLVLTIAILILQGCTALDHDARINFLEGQVKDVLEKSVEGGVTSRDVRKKMADYGAQVDTLQGQIQILAGRIEEFEAGGSPRENPIFLQEGVLAEIRNLKERLQFLEARVADFEKILPQGKPSELKIPAPGETVPSIPPLTVPTPGTETQAPVPSEKGEPSLSEDQQAYNLAMKTLKEGKYEKAIREFRGFIKKYPGSDLNDNAQYWLGESYYAQKKYEEAIIEFEEVVQQYPKGEKVPAALLKEGLAFHALKDNNPARQILKKLIDQYPDSEEAKLAEQKLKEIF